MTPKRDRPETLHSSTQRIDTGVGKVYVTITEDEDGEPFEVFVNAGSSGGFRHSWCNALGKTMSNALRSGSDPIELAEDIMGTRTDKIANDNGDTVLSIPDAVGIAMRRHVEGSFGESIREGPPEGGMP